MLFLEFKTHILLIFFYNTSIDFLSIAFEKTPIGSMTIWFFWGWRALDFVAATSST